MEDRSLLLMIVYGEIQSTLCRRIILSTMHNVSSLYEELYVSRINYTKLHQFIPHFI